jgi:hypothetical protein
MIQCCGLGEQESVDLTIKGPTQVKEFYFSPYFNVVCYIRSLDNGEKVSRC